jgi:hypothetical protein
LIGTIFARQEKHDMAGIIDRKEAPVTGGASGYRASDRDGARVAVADLIEANAAESPQMTQTLK